MTSITQLIKLIADSKSNYRELNLIAEKTAKSNKRKMERQTSYSKLVAQKKKLQHKINLIEKKYVTNSYDIKQMLENKIVEKKVEVETAIIGADKDAKKKEKLLNEFRNWKPNFR